MVSDFPQRKFKAEGGGGGDKMTPWFSYCNGYLFCLESTHPNASG